MNCEPLKGALSRLGITVALGGSKSTDTYIVLLNCSDICSAFGAQVHPLLEKPAINELLQEGRRSKTHKTKQVATWATKELRKLKQQQVCKRRRPTGALLEQGIIHGLKGRTDRVQYTECVVHCSRMKFCFCHYTENNGPFNRCHAIATIFRFFFTIVRKNFLHRSVCDVEFSK